MVGGTTEAKWAKGREGDNGEAIGGSKGLEGGFVVI